jgi:hypothetical protein
MLKLSESLLTNMSDGQLAEWNFSITIFLDLEKSQISSLSDISKKPFNRTMSIDLTTNFTLIKDTSSILISNVTQVMI